MGVRHEAIPGAMVANVRILRVEPGGKRYQVWYGCCGSVGYLSLSALEQRARQESERCTRCANVHRFKVRAVAREGVPTRRKVSTSDALRAWLRLTLPREVSA